MRQFVAWIYCSAGFHHVVMKSLGKEKTTIIVYHDPSPETFRAHLDHLSRNHTFIPLSALADAIRTGDRSGLPPNSLVITFDDGHKGNYLLLDLFRKFRVRPTLYLCSHIVNTNRHFWWKNDGIPVPELKKTEPGPMLEFLLEKTDYEPEREYPDRQALSLAELLEMAPDVEFGSHSKFHPILTKCDDERCFREIADSKKFLEELLNRPIEHFVYPNGDYEEREINYLKRCGYKTGRTLDLGRNGKEADPFRLKAIAIEDDASVNILRAQISGFFCYIKYLKYGSLRGLRPGAI